MTTPSGIPVTIFGTSVTDCVPSDPDINGTAFTTSDLAARDAAMMEKGFEAARETSEELECMSPDSYKITNTYIYEDFASYLKAEENK